MASLNLTQALYTKLASDTKLKNLLSTYNGNPAIFTTDPAPGDAVLPYIVASTVPVQTAFDTKQERGRQVWRDIRCYTEPNGSSVTVEAIAERVIEILHREKLNIDEYEVIVAECSGWITADDGDSYGRIVTLKLTILEN